MWIAELTEDECAEECTDEPTGCPEEGCADCSIICSSCPRAHLVVPTQAMRLGPEVFVARFGTDAAERVPVDPPPEGVFHPPRLAG